MLGRKDLLSQTSLSKVSRVEVVVNKSWFTTIKCDIGLHLDSFPSL